MAFVVVSFVVATLVAFVSVVAVEALPDKVAVIVPAEKLPEASRATIAETVLALVALEVTVNDEFPDWFAVNEAEPDSPVPETARVNVPSPGEGTAAQEAAVPLVVK